MTCAVVIATYNGEKYISEQLNSILSQTVQPHKIIISDDTSTDHTIDICKTILRNYTGKYSIVQNCKGKGVTNNFFNGIELCKEDIIFLCDQDDIWLNCKIEKSIKLFEEHKDCVMTLSNAYIWNCKNEKEIDYNKLNTTFSKLNISKLADKNGKVDMEQYTKILIEKNIATGMSMAFKREYIDVPPKDLILLHDNYISLVCAAKGNVYFVNSCMSLYRQHKNNVQGMHKKPFYKKIAGLKKKNILSIKKEYQRIKLIEEMDNKTHFLSEENKKNYLDNKNLIEKRKTYIIKHNIMGLLLFALKSDLYKKKFSILFIIRDFATCVSYRGEFNESI